SSRSFRGKRETRDATARSARRLPYKYGADLLIESELRRAPDELQLRVHAELRVRVREMSLDRSLADEQPVRDLARRQSVCCEPSDLPFAAAQRRHAHRRRNSVSA